MKRLLITIDGPSGAGKTTISRKVASRLGYTYVDTGALYRAVALAVSRRAGSALDQKGLEELCRGLKLEFANTANGPILLLDGTDISEEIRTQEITMLASRLSAEKVVRQQLLGIQRQLGKAGGIVFEGRDMGTVVFPGADIKFFLFAAPQVRARRRYNELLAKGHAVALSEVSETMRKRDRDDSSRALAPLKPASDAIQIDSSDLTEGQVVNLVLHHVENLSTQIHRQKDRKKGNKKETQSVA